MTVSIQTALHFIRQARRDQAIQRAMGALGDEVTLGRIVQVAATAGFTFSAEELREAHRHDWAMRWARDHAHGTDHAR